MGVEHPVACVWLLIVSAERRSTRRWVPLDKHRVPGTCLRAHTRRNARPAGYRLRRASIVLPGRTLSCRLLVGSYAQRAVLCCAVNEAAQTHGFATKW